MERIGTLSLSPHHFGWVAKEKDDRNTLEDGWWVSTSKCPLKRSQIKFITTSPLERLRRPVLMQPKDTFPSGDPSHDEAREYLPYESARLVSPGIQSPSEGHIHVYTQFPLDPLGTLRWFGGTIKG